MHQIRERHRGPKADQNMRMVRHTMNRQQLLFPFPDNASEIFMEFLLVLLVNQALPPFDSKNNLKVDLGIRVGHRRDSVRAARRIKRKMIGGRVNERISPAHSNVFPGCFNYASSCLLIECDTRTPLFFLFFSGARWQFGDKLSATVARAAEKQKWGSWGS